MLPIISTVLNIADKFFPDADSKLKFKEKLLQHESEIEKQFVEYAKLDYDLRIKELEHKGFKAAWRPLIMMLLSACMVLYLFMYYIIPQIITIFNINSYYLEPVPMPDVVWHVFAFCIVGVSGLRTIDKWRSKK